MSSILDGYDYTADVPPGTPLLVQSADGRVWRLSRRGVRYHEDVRSLLHGAAPARPPKDVAASARIRALLEALIEGGGELPATAEPLSRWRDAPISAGSMASTDSLSLYPDRWVRACKPVYDDLPRTGVQQLTAREWAALEADIAIAPRGVRLPRVEVRERPTCIRPPAVSGLPEAAAEAEASAANAEEANAEGEEEL